VRIFISYRRDDTKGITGRIREHLEKNFGHNSVYRDIESIPPGANFRWHLSKALSECDVLLAVIGDKWLAAAHSDQPDVGGRRLWDPTDLVRTELESALAREITVIPVLIDQASMPKARDLPEVLHRLCDRQWTRVSDEAFDTDVKRLIDAIRAAKPPCRHVRSNTQFSKKLLEVEEFIAHWKELTQRMAKWLDEEADRHLQQLSRQVDRSYREMKARFERPELTFATAGTTSSGKSTVVNLLCGTTLIPSAVGEMSAGVVTVLHGGRRSLRIRKTRGATWDCHAWDGLAHDRIRERLARVMQAYHDISTERDRPDHPQFEIEFPTRIGGQLQKLGLPPTCTYRILDLPGMKHLGDTANLQLVERCREALCLVTYNSEETDATKQKHLLEQVVNQVKTLGGSPNRMIFVINKIDVFRKDENWEQSERHEVARITNQIKNAIRAHLPEYADDVANLNIVTLSSDPALCARMIYEGSRDERAAGAERIANHYMSLLPNDIKDQLPASSKKWRDTDLESVAAAIVEHSHGEDFEKTLHQHARKHLVSLVMVPAIEAFLQNAGRRAVEWIVQTAHLNQNRAGDRFLQQCERINASKRRLRETQTELIARLLRPFQQIRELLKDPQARCSPNLVRDVKRALDELRDQAVFPDLPPGILTPLYSWPDVLDDAIESVLGVLMASTGQMGSQPEDRLRDILPEGALRLIREAIRCLGQSGYGRNICRKGLSARITKPEEQRRIDTVLRALQDLERAVERALQDAIKVAAQRELRRICECLERILDFAVERLAEIASEHTKMLWGGSASAHGVQIEATLSLDLQLSADFKVNEEIMSEVHESSFAWYDLRRWLGQRRIENKELRQVEARIPPIKAIVGAWKVQAAYKLPDVINQVNEWLIAEITSVSVGFAKVQQKVIGDYESDLHRAHERAAGINRSEVKFWEGVVEECRKLDERLGAIHGRGSATGGNDDDGPE
jgi:predicted GTPase